MAAPSTLEAPEQLRLPLTDELPGVEPPVPLYGLERLGETAEFGSLLLRLLELNGWHVAQLRGFAGDGVLVIARKGPFEVARTGARLADIATDVFREAMHLKGAV
jgi:hypothetical protein